MRIFISIFLLSFSLQALCNSYHTKVLADTSIMLGAVQVEAYQVNQPLQSIPGSISLVAGSAINISDGSNMATLLNTLPGITMQSGTYATNRIVIRGMGSRTPYNTNRIRSYLNDIPLTSSDGISTPEEIDLSALGRIEVLKGPSSALYGSGLGGTINLYTPQNKSSKGIIGSQYGSFNTIKTNLNGSLGNTNNGFGLSVNHLQTDGYRHHNNYHRTSVVSSAHKQFSSSQLDATMLILNSNGQIPSSIGESLFASNPQAAAGNWQAIGGYKATRKALGGLTLTNRISANTNNRFTVFGRYNNNYEKRPFNNLDDRSSSFGFRNKLNYHTQKTDWVLGFEAINENYHWAIDKDNIQLNKNRENRQQINLFGLFHGRINPNLNISIAAALNHINYRLSDEFLANGDQSGERGFPLIFSPRIGMNYQLKQGINLYASVGHGFSLPSPEETLLPGGDINTDIKPEQGIQTEIGIRANILNNRLFADAALYHIELTNLLVTKRLSEDIFTGINAGQTRHQGIEFQMNGIILQRKSFPGILTSNLAYAIGKHRFIDFNDNGNIYDGKQLPGIPKQTVQWLTTWEPATDFLFEVHASFTDKQYLNDSNTKQYGSFALINIKSSYRYKLSQKLAIQISAGINNLSDTHYASMLLVNALAFGNNEARYYYPGMGQHMYLGLKFFIN